MRKISTLLLILFSITTFIQAQNATLKVGDIAPIVKGTNQFGHAVLSSDIVSDKYLALVFYRGNWCSHCKRHLSELADSFEELEVAGIEVVLVTPENSNGVDQTLEATETEYSIIADTTYEILDAYETKYKINAQTVPKFTEAVKKRTQNANGNDEGILTVPATFLLNKEHEIIWIHYDKDYTKRSKVEDILQAVANDQLKEK